jgi:ribosomal protein L37AE/L43A
MDRFIWLLLALYTLLLAFSVVAATLRRRRLGVDQTTRHCPHCETPMSMRRVSLFQSHTLRGVWECPHCGARINRVGRRSGTVT